MIALDYDILFSLKVGVENTPFSNKGFRVGVSSATDTLLHRYQSIFRFIDDKFDPTTESIAYVFASDVLATFTSSPYGIATVDKDLFASLLIYPSNPSVVRTIDFSFVPQNLVALDRLLGNVKPVFYKALQAQVGPFVLDEQDIIALVPTVLSFPKNEIDSIVYESNNRLFSAESTDDLTIQYNFRTASTGVYLVNFKNPVEVKKIYVAPDLFRKPPLAIAEVTVLQGNFALKEYELEFKKKT